MIGPRAVRLYPLYHPAAALYTPSTLETLRADFARIPEILALGPPEQPKAPVAPLAPAPPPEAGAGSAGPPDPGPPDPGPPDPGPPDPEQLGLF
jgi:DNA polymerase